MIRNSKRMPWSGPPRARCYWPRPLLKAWTPRRYARDAVAQPFHFAREGVELHPRRRQARLLLDEIAQVAPQRAGRVLRPTGSGPGGVPRLMRKGIAGETGQFLFRAGPAMFEEPGEPFCYGGIAPQIESGPPCDRRRADQAIGATRPPA